MDVLSAGTKSHDRRAKFELYQDLSSIKDYIVVETKVPGVLLCRREQTIFWTIHMLKSEEEIELANIGGRLPLAEIYKTPLFSKQRTRAV
jgi:Uma2 family endonuclease